MTWKIHHVNLPAHDVRESASFFNAIFGMREGVFQRPSSGGDFRSDPAALAAFEQEGADAVGLGVNNGLHIVKPVPSFAKANGLQHNPTIGGHVAITVPDLDAVKRRLDDAGIMYSDAGQYAMLGYRQIYLYDPSMNLLEVNQRVGP
jgi:catechol 2,3-dioxygenase-like lactoylglutathione lyase family enzyme